MNRKIKIVIDVEQEPLIEKNGEKNYNAGKTVAVVTINGAAAGTFTSKYGWSVSADLGELIGKTL